MPRIIRPDKASPIILSDEKQMREPFISFLKETKEVRDASMHFAPGKASIVHPPQEWLRLVEEAVKNAVAVAREFWSACYPERQQPKYLASLYYDGLLQEALDRLAAAESATIQSTPKQSRVDRHRASSVKTSFTSRQCLLAPGIEPGEDFLSRHDFATLSRIDRLLVSKASP